MSDPKNIYEEWKKMQEDFMKIWFPWAEAPTQFSGFTGFPGSGPFVNSLMDMWKKTAEHGGSKELPMDMFQEATKGFYSVLMDQWMPFVQGGMGFFTEKDFGMERFREMMDMWKKGMEGLDFFTKLPPLGPGREILEKQQQMMEAFETYQELWMKGMYAIQNFSIQSGTRMYRKYLAESSKGIRFLNFEDFYDFWMKEMREEYELLLESEDFKVLMKQITDALGTWKKYSDGFMEDVLSFYPIPSMKDFDSLSKSVYELKTLYRDEQQRKIDDLEARIRKLEER